MSSKSEILKSLERKVIGSKRSSTFSNAFWVSGETEVNYLMGGYATELIDVVYLPRVYERDADAKIYGVVGKNQNRGRYLWIYLYHSHNLWRFHSLKDSYKLIEKLKQHYELEKKVYNYRYRNAVRAKKKDLCDN